MCLRIIDRTAAPKSLQDDKTYQVQADLGLCNMDIKLYICGPTKPP